MVFLVQHLVIKRQVVLVFPQISMVLLNYIFGFTVGNWLAWLHGLVSLFAF